MVAFDPSRACNGTHDAGGAILYSNLIMSVVNMVTELPAECPIDLNGIAEQRKWLLSYARPNSIGAEFGVFRGHFAAVIARELKPRKLFLVDPWTKSGERFGWGPDPYTNYDMLTTAEALLDTRHRMAPYEHMCDITYVEDTLENFAADIKKYGVHKLDFAYLDTSHSYDVTPMTTRLDKLISWRE